MIKPIIEFTNLRCIWRVDYFSATFFNALFIESSIEGTFFFTDPAMKEASVSINGVFDSYPLERRNENGSLTLGMNRDHTDSRRMQESQGLLNILNNTDNGKSTINWIRDFNTIHNTEHSINRATIERSSHDRIHGLPLTSLTFDVR